MEHVTAGDSSCIKVKGLQSHWSRPKGRLSRVKLGSRCSMPQKEGTVVSVARVQQEVSKQTHAINKSEVYSHYLGLLFRRTLALMAHQGGGVGVQRHNRDKPSEDTLKNKGKCRKKKTHVAHREANWPVKTGVI